MGDQIPEPSQAVRQAALAAGWSHRHRDVSGGWLRPTVFGAVDGLVTNASLIAGLGGGADVARSAIGQDAAGDLMYAASMSAVPADLASVLASHGARIAMELDINPEWVQLDVARSPGGPLTAGVPGQDRSADQYLVGWTRDFVAVLAAPAPSPAAPSARLLP